MARNIVAYVHEFDMLNLYGPPPLLDEIAEAGSGAKDVAPQKTLREHNYGTMPLIILPEYSGDFLEKLKAPFQGKAIEAADDENLWDFSMPSEWLKHQEEPHPRILIDQWYDIGGKPGEQSGYQTLKDYWDRSWDGEAPYWSEDVKELNRQPKMDGGCPRKIPLQALRRVMASYLMDYMPVGEFDTEELIKVAKTLQELEDSRVNGLPVKSKLIHGSVSLAKAEPSVGRWTFHVGASQRSQKHRQKAEHRRPNFYTVVFQFIPKANVRDVNKLDVKVVCDCDSFLYYGAQFHAVMENYLYGNVIRPKVAPPKVRDKENRFFACKHIVACINLVKGYKLKGVDIDESRIEKLKAAPTTYKLHKDFKPEKLRIPPELAHIENRPHIKEMMDKWTTLKGPAKARMLNKLTNPDEIGFMAHRYPEATQYLVNKLIEIAKESKEASVAKEAEKIAGYWI